MWRILLSVKERTNDFNPAASYVQIDFRSWEYLRAKFDAEAV